MIKELKHLTKEEYKLYKEYIKSGSITEDNGQWFYADLADPFGEKPLDIFDLVRLLSGFIKNTELLGSFTKEELAVARHRYNLEKQIKWQQDTIDRLYDKVGK